MWKRLIGRLVLLCVKTLCVSYLCLSQAYSAEHSVLFVSGSHSNQATFSVLKRYAAELNVAIKQEKQSNLGDFAAAEALFNRYDLVVLDAISSREQAEIFTPYGAFIPRLKTRLISLKAPDITTLNQGLSSEQIERLAAYYQNGGSQNLQNLASYLQALITGEGDMQAMQAPIIFPSIGLYHPDAPSLTFETLDAYLNWRGLKAFDNSKPMIGILLQRAAIESVSTEVIDQLILQLESKGAIAVPFYFELSPRVSDYSSLIQKSGRTVVDLIINLRSIHWASQRAKEFTGFGVPVMQALTYFSGDQQQWEQDKQGIAAGMTPFVLTLPESAGVVDPMIIAAVDEASGKSQPIDYQLKHLVQKALNVVALKYKKNSAKKMTVMVWGDKDVGASFLNVPDSLRAISQRLNAEGYDIDKVDNAFFTERVDRILNPFYRDYQLEKLLEDDLAELMPVDAYQSWLNSLPAHITQPITDYWGEPQDNFMVVERQGQHYFVLPRIRNGNMLVMRQPPRSDDKDQDQLIYHQGEVPMNHYYLAAYYYARVYWQSDAIIHLGTHGSQEWLGGKERGLSMYDEGNLAVWDTPVIYPFIVDDVGEAMQTKRRGRATVLAHMTPPFAAAGLQGDISALHELMHQYNELDEGGVKQKTAQQIIDDCLASHVCADFGWQREAIEADFAGFMVALHDHMIELSAENQPLGLHSFGELAEPRLLTSTIVQMLGIDFTTHAGPFERKYFHHSGHDHDHDHDHKAAKHDHAEPSQHGNEALHHDGDELEAITGFKTVEAFVIAAFDQQRLKPESAIAELDRQLPADLLPFIEKGREMYRHLLGIKELDHLVMSLRGEYIPVKNGGDPVRHPEALPTGFNLYGFDPSRVPTQAAYQQGSELTASIIADYYNKYGEYPDKLAFSLWSIETMRHYGVLEAQALSAMGVRPRWSPDGRVIGTEIIPADELKRPRIDVVLSATGLYRDAFPNVMQMLAKAVEQVAALKEEGNFVWRNSVRIKSSLIEEGVAADEAEYLSTVRLFSNASGNYSSGVDAPIFNSDTWESDSKIAENFMQNMGYFFGSDDSRWGQSLENINLFAKQLSGTDVALFSRSSNLYGMITSDDPFEFFGALSLAVRNLDGQSPEMLISNLRDANRGKAQSAAQFMSRELRTRNFHKRWVEEMMKEGYSGAVTLSSNLANFWGWQVVDPAVVRDDQWQEFFEVYINDKLQLEINEWFEEINPAAQGRMLETMLESVRKDYWQANADTIKAMLERYLELANEYELFLDNEKLRDFINQQAVGFGLQALPAPAEVAAAAGATAEQVEGQRLEQVNQQQTDTESSLTRILLLLGGCLLVFLTGFGQKLRPRAVCQA